MTLLIGSLTMGLILALLAFGVLISFRILAFRDLTADGSLTLGGSVAAALLVSGWNPWAATFVAVLSGALAGATTGVLAMKCKINGLLAGILVMTALYSVNLRVMGKSNVPLMESRTILSSAEQLADASTHWRIWIGLWPGQFGYEDVFLPLALDHDMSVIGLVLLMIAAVGVGMVAFFRTNLGLAMRATGDNPDMIRALGVDVDWMTTLGLAIANGLTAFAGALLVQYQGFADVQMGIGMVVLGFASVIIGETLVGSRIVGFLICGAVMGSVLFRLLVAIALRWGLNPNDLKLVTAVFVLAALVTPDLWKAARKQLSPAR